MEEEDMLGMNVVLQVVVNACYLTVLSLQEE